MTDDSGTPPGTGQPGDDDRRYTETEVERIVQDRLKRARIDVEGIDQLRAQAEQIPRLEARIQTLSRERDSAREESQRNAERADSSLLRAEVVSAATRAGAVDPEDVFRLLPDGAVTLEEGRVVGAEEAVKALSESKGHLFGSTAGRRPSGGDGGARDDGGGSPGRQPDMSQMMRRAAGFQR